ncbi:MAG: hypothetical protein KGL36_05985 [Gammaproteobacteria bacterium]|nr:hypothetical protein [Gammaproteobacteria bacterium]
MVNKVEPVAGQWYHHLDRGQTFQVIDANLGEGWIEIQSFDGEIEQLSAEDWRALAVETCDPPEDWTGPYDDVERDDLGYTDTEMTSEDWRAPVEGAPPGREAWQDPSPDDAIADWSEGRPEEPYGAEREAARHKVR